MLTLPFVCAPGRAQTLGGVSPLYARQGEALAEGQGQSREAMSEGSPLRNTGLMNKNPIGGWSVG